MFFDAIKNKHVVAWNLMIVGYPKHGFTEDALRVFDIMCRRGVHLTNIIVTGTLSACAHAGLVSEGWRFFLLMKDESGLNPRSSITGVWLIYLAVLGI